MDPISASAFNLHAEENARAILNEQKKEEQFNEIIVSCRSLSGYESSKFKSLLPQVTAAALAASFHIVVGISLAYSAILIPQLEEESGDMRTTEEENSWIASVIVVIVPIGSIAGGFIMDSIGRLNTIKLAAIPGSIGWILIAMATNVPMIIIGRLLTGLSSAWGTSPAIVYITEIAKADMRGSLISFAPAYASLGMVLAYLKGWFMNWRLVAWLCNVYTLLPVVLIMLIPESPAWLISKGRYEQAGKSLNWLHKYQPQPEHKTETLGQLHLNALIKENQQKIEDQANSPNNSRTRKLKAFMHPTGYKPIFILCGLFFFQQFAGIYITLFYAVTFFKEVGSDFNPYFASVLIGTVRFVMSMVNTYMLRRFERRPLVMISAAGMSICMFLSGLFTMWIKEGTTTMTWVPVVCLLMYVVTSMIGLLPIPWTMTAELFPIEIRGIAHSVVYSIANGLMFASIKSYITLDYYFKGAAGVQFFFGVVSLAGLVYTFIFLPETHGKKFTEIFEYFNTNTIYLVQKKKTGTLIKKTQEKKPIVKNTRASDLDYMKASNGQNEKMINNV